MEVVAILEHELKHAQSAVLTGVSDVEVRICRYLDETHKREKATRAGKRLTNGDYQPMDTKRRSDHLKVARTSPLYLLLF